MNIFKFSLSFSFLKHAFLSFRERKSPMRIIHNFFLNNVNINGLTLDLGAGKNQSYFNFLKKEDLSLTNVDLYNHSEINRILKVKSKLEIFVPFLIGYHKDPNDVFRPTHNYLLKILKENGFEGETKLIGVGPFIVAYQMLHRYFKFAFIKLFFLIIVLCLDKIISIFSKDYSTYYCGTHISASKI